MYDPYIMRRTQIYLDEAQADVLSRRARSIGTTSSHLIREAVAGYLAAIDRDDDSIILARQRAAIEAAFGTLSRLPDSGTYLASVRRGEVERLAMLDEHWAVSDGHSAEAD
jgi:hypothetical protein